MRTGRLLGAGRTADVYELHADEGESGADGPDGLGTVTGTAAPGGAADRDGADSHTGRGGRDGRTERGGGAWVLRRYRDGWGDAAAEAEVMEYVRGHGYPVPRVRSATRTEMVLEHLSGPTLLEACAAGRIAPPEAGATLAHLLRALHAVPPRHRPGVRVLHLDLHPDNVVLTPHGPQVIDWNNTEEGPPGLDWGVSATILAQVAVDPTDPRAPLAHATLTSLLAHRPADTLTPHDLTEAIHRRASTPTMSSRETELLGRAEQLIRRVMSAEAEA
ncbi:Phosphotransferase enzyme family protein [Streptomyces sp. cf124]|uniref:phosphotransferase n=1 Tax=Streptomyces sp. cf124 TaxID=1761903 RepID=UPI0008EB233C|nr:phosphotransferase [Streptomyces sp. cf124]SFM72302.1 Phosphotransferase enzyme family protein [Streptomyces sp. cf124]